MKGSSTLSNLITLCTKCHQKTEGVEELYMDRYFALLNTSDNKNLNYAQHAYTESKDPKNLGNDFVMGDRTQLTKQEIKNFYSGKKAMKKLEQYI